MSLLEEEDLGLFGSMTLRSKVLVHLLFIWQTYILQHYSREIHVHGIYLISKFYLFMSHLSSNALWNLRYIVSFLLDSSVGLLVIYGCIRLTVKLADKWKWCYLYFGEYGIKLRYTVIDPRALLNK